MESENPKKLQKIVGEVIACNTPKTIQVKASIFKVHSKYKKRYLVTKKYVAHDEKGQCKVGDKVEIVASKSYSRTKHFIVSKVI
ncbi:MAG: 30S ribosomal protein S17 [Candidatus Doudnabacteria bacterium CG10_big_fil_rev_8_21_14_0_10_41_10]|uniref:30S ribosomal protein S17 n=1 Tax=Candidatus Doudnabacteria bacterium CG10_big_fil_rev_8_21_14_0_10_41_10 TaxID=1974551 RepID=A0A2H0VDG7_9BACT|nr:MAG: 30S ribosomal protein S17 [Candidatus Doudnabacteria bacterium CG10_big_fil_rev_8_21_14_0_10_41_10]